VLAFSAVVVAGCGNVKTLAPDAAMPSGDDAGSDAALDAMPVGVAKYDIAYIDDITMGSNITSIFSFILVVNKGTVPLKLETTSVVTYSDDSASIDWQLTKNGATSTLLKPDHAAGSLAPDASAKLVDSGLVPEPIDDNMLNFTMAFPNMPPSGVTLKAQAVLRIETADVVLPFTINLVASGIPKYNVAARVSSQN
jgi:hypothetical protein